MDTYTVEADGHGGYQVRIVDENGAQRPAVAGFATAAQAQQWVDNKIQISMKMATSSDIT